jgi:hypothetical protein
MAKSAAPIKTATLVLAVYLAVFLVTIILHYYTNASIISFIFISFWGIWIYALFFLPFFAAVIHLLQIQRTNSAPIYNTAFVFLVMLFCTHVMYWACVSIYKRYVASEASPTEEKIRNELFKVTVKAKSLSVNPEATGQHIGYILNAEVTNPLSEAVILEMSTSMISWRPSSTQGLKPYIGNRKLFSERIPPGVTETLRIKISGKTMFQAQEYHGYFPVTYTLTKPFSGYVHFKRTELSHELCQWSLITCPGFGGYHTGSLPFEDKKLHVNEPSYVQLEGALIDRDHYGYISDFEYQPNPKLYKARIPDN